MRGVISLSCAILTSGCLFSGGPGSGDDADPVARDSAQYDRLTSQLEIHRTPFLGEEADELQAATQRIFWLEYPVFDPTLHSAKGPRIDYSFALGTEGNYRASDTLVVTATRTGDTVAYRAYAADTGTSRGELALPAPADGQVWWAYAVASDTVYLVTTGSSTTVLRWVPGAEPQTEVVLEDVGVDVGEFQDVGVFGRHMLFIESGRLWELSLATHVATWTGNTQQITGGISTDGIGVLYTAADGPYYLTFGGGTPRDLRAEIAASDYRLNATYATIHTYASQAVLSHQHVVYKGQSGVFVFDLKSQRVAPVLLEPRASTPRIVYIDPQILDDGTIYLTGLESDSGAVGAEGPVYSLQLADVLAEPAPSLR
ncbi:MAG: hypothetical protein H6Q90_4273 [Deltaproteobacteria bacterium]|nr:hypothetical protein [Deltaproteobacteria bacterium]